MVLKVDAWSAFFERVSAPSNSHTCAHTSAQKIKAAGLEAEVIG